MNHKRILESLTACEEAIRWYNDKDSKEAWASCERGDWLLWIAANLRIDRKLIVLAACDCAEQSFYLIPEEEKRPKMAIETARAWARGETSLEKVKVAARAATNATYSTYATHATNAAYAAVNAAYSAVDTVNAYAAAACATAAVAIYAADYSTRKEDYSTRKEGLKKSAELVRNRISWILIKEKLDEL